jgi:hypothetical protein
MPQYFAFYIVAYLYTPSVMYTLSVGMKTDHILNIKPKIGMRVNLGNSVVLTKWFSDDQIKD